MPTSRQGISSEEMEQVVAQRVANAIEAIAIYESKIRMAHDLMNQVVREEATVGKNVSNKRKWGSDQGRNFDQQQSKRIEVVKAHATRAGNKKSYAGNLPYCNKCKLHHTGPCAVKCGNCKRVGHMKKYCKTSATATFKRAPIANQKPAYKVNVAEGVNAASEEVSTAELIWIKILHTWWLHPKFLCSNRVSLKLLRMRIEQYIQMIDYALWEVIENGATLPKIAVVEGVEKVMPITSTKDKA
ncbi:hypothetical protein Tco_1501489 [Tanacetum coccineum]